jgi:putative ABC transport system permease protein
MTVVGVSRDTRHYGLDEEMRQGIFQPLAQVPLRSATFVVRSAVDPAGLVPQVRSLLEQLDPDVPLVEPETMGRILERSLWERRIVAWLFSVFAGLALVLAVGGIYGVISYTVTQRHLEIGLRMALGAREGQVLREVARQGMVLVGIGAALGLLAAYGMARGISSIFYGVGTGNPLLYLLVVTVLLAAGAMANLLPARKAARVSPIRALRSGE